MKKGIVIVNYNDYETTLTLLNNIKNYKVFDKIVIVDNHSTDSSYEVLSKEESGNIKVIETLNNLGYSYALNIGCKYLIELYKECKIIISNSDIIINKEKDIIDLYDLISKDNVIVGPTILEHNTKNRGWIIPKTKDDIMLNTVFAKKYQSKHLSYSDDYYKGKTTKVDTVSGSFFGIYSKHLENINYFDENVFLYYEENIMGVKTKVLNKNIIVANNINVIHNHSVSIDKSLKRIKKFDILKKSQYYFEKEYNNASVFKLIILTIFRYITRIILLIKYLFT